MAPTQTVLYMKIIQLKNIFWSGVQQKQVFNMNARDEYFKTVEER